MAKNDPVKEALQSLNRVEARSADGQSEIRVALYHASSLVVARAARKVAEHRLLHLKTELVQAFQRLLEAGPSADRGCEAKTALAFSLVELGTGQEALFAQGAVLVQKEAAYGGPVDTAAELRGLCGLGLVRCRKVGVLEDLAILLADPEPVARTLAARAVVENGEEQGSALLLLRLLSGEDFPDVVLECMSGLFALCGERAVGYLRRHFLLSPVHEMWPMAVLALGESRSGQALQVLLELYPSTLNSGERKPLLEAIAMTRLGSALDFLRDLSQNEPKAIREEALEVIERFWGTQLP